MEINESNYAACIARIAERGSLGKEDARALLEAVAEAGEKQRRSGVEDPIATAAWADDRYFLALPRGGRYRRRG
jgi:hypothetical protein